MRVWLCLSPRERLRAFILYRINDRSCNEKVGNRQSITASFFKFHMNLRRLPHDQSMRVRPPRMTTGYRKCCVGDYYFHFSKQSKQKHVIGQSRNQEISLGRAPLILGSLPICNVVNFMSSNSPICLDTSLPLAIPTVQSSSFWLSARLSVRLFWFHHVARRCLLTQLSGCAAVSLITAFLGLHPKVQSSDNMVQVSSSRTMSNRDFIIV